MTKSVNMKRILGIIAIAFLTSIATFIFAKKYIYGDNIFAKEKLDMPNLSEGITQTALSSPSPDGGYVNLEDAAENSSKAVVHIKTESRSQRSTSRSPFDSFFGDMFDNRSYQQPQSGSGSGVIISADGYIVTNNHVVDGADKVTVTFNNKRTVKATVTGRDPSTDLAVLKVDESNLPFLKFGNSDDVRLGQWVLAVGYPLNLETTVTAGIVSAKHRSIGINQRKARGTAVESFIQTDAAVNPGNSGGALVNSSGMLIGINSAIASPTGSYAGYSYAIPSNLVRKVVDDLIKHGNVQRGYLGVGYMDAKNATPEQISAYKLDEINGVYISMVSDDGAAKKAGLKKGDIITKVGSRMVNTGPKLIESVAQYRPGDKVKIDFLRGGKAQTTYVTLKNKLGTTKVVKRDINTELGANFQELNKKDASKLGVSGGVMVTELMNGALSKYTRIQKGFVISQINDQKVSTMADLNQAFNSGEKEFQIAGSYPGREGLYYFNFRLN